MVSKKNRSYLFTSESVSEGHPDKIADQIADAILDAYIARVPEARVACEALVTRNRVFVAGEFHPLLDVSIDAIVRSVVEEIGYDDPKYGFDCRSCLVETEIAPQSAAIGQAVDRGGEIGAGDQGLMFGFAVSETPVLMPLAIHLSHRLMERHSAVRKSGEYPWLGPDAKSQVTIRYEGPRPVAVEKIVLSTLHDPEINRKTIEEAVREEIIRPTIPEALRSPRIEYLVNPSGRFDVGGPVADTGLTGRKIIVDTYGASCPHGGGSFSGKDPTKVDRSGSYVTRYIAKNIVAAGLADRCTVQVSYAIGRVHPTSLMIDTHGTGKVDAEKLERAVGEIFALTPKGMIDLLDLRRPIYRKTAAYGHFGRELPEFTWEQTNRVDALRRSLDS